MSGNAHSRRRDYWRYSHSDQSPFSTSSISLYPICLFSFSNRFLGDTPYGLLCVAIGIMNHNFQVLPGISIFGVFRHLQTFPYTQELSSILDPEGSFTQELTYPVTLRVGM